MSSAGSGSDENKMRTCVIIPTYNESKAIAGLLGQVKAMDLDMIVVDDGSRDDTAQIARGCGARVLSNQRNSGKGASLIKGILTLSSTVLTRRSPWMVTASIQPRTFRFSYKRRLPETAGSSPATAWG
jgi:cellulose synthase/poly-beta-1,6-N-acetylglucosamine synthase-like glycosyltransferase